MRKLLINTIIDLAGDEFETIEDALELAMETDEQLIKRIINIANYYKNEC